MKTWHFWILAIGTYASAVTLLVLLVLFVGVGGKASYSDSAFMFSLVVGAICTFHCGNLLRRNANNQTD